MWEALQTALRQVALLPKQYPCHSWGSRASGHVNKTQGWSLGTRHRSERLSREGRCPRASVHTPVFSLLSQTTKDKLGLSEPQSPFCDMAEWPCCIWMSQVPVAQPALPTVTTACLWPGALVRVSPGDECTSTGASAGRDAKEALPPGAWSADCSANASKGHAIH